METYIQHVNKQNDNILRNNVVLCVRLYRMLLHNSKTNGKLAVYVIDVHNELFISSTILVFLLLVGQIYIKANDFYVLGKQC